MNKKEEEEEEEKTPRRYFQMNKRIDLLHTKSARHRWGGLTEISFFS